MSNLNNKARYIIKKSTIQIFVKSYITSDPLHKLIHNGYSLQRAMQTSI